GTHPWRVSGSYHRGCNNVCSLPQGSCAGAWCERTICPTKCSEVSYYAYSCERFYGNSACAADCGDFSGETSCSSDCAGCQNAANLGDNDLHVNFQTSFNKFS